VKKCESTLGVTSQEIYKCSCTFYLVSLLVSLKPLKCVVVLFLYLTKDACVCASRKHFMRFLYLHFQCVLSFVCSSLKRRMFLFLMGERSDV